MAFARVLFKILLALLGLFVVVGLFLPSQALVERSIDIQAPVDRVFPHVNGMRAFHAWSPWSAMDPNTRYAFEGPEQGVGSRMHWQSNQQDVGVGSMEIVFSEPDREVRNKLDFGGKGEATATFLLTPQDDGSTNLLWRFETSFGWDLFGRYIGLMFDQMIGSSYETGLQTLKQRAEAG